CGQLALSIRLSPPRNGLPFAMKNSYIPTLTIVTILVLAATATAQKPLKPWTTWSDKEAEKMLNDSPWGQTQVDTNTSEMTYSPTSGGAGGVTRAGTANTTATMRGEQAERNQNRSQEGAYNRAVSVSYHVRFLSARPIREAIAQSASQKCL